VTIENPLSEDQSVMRPTLLGSLLDAARHNVARGTEAVAIFESGTVYRGGDGPLADEHHGLGVLVSGAIGARGWRGEEAPGGDFFTVKGLLEGLLEALGVEWGVQHGDWPFLHPGRSASVLLGDGSLAGFVGELHPLVSERWDLGQTAAFAIDLGKIAAAAPEVVRYSDVTSFPPVREDIAVIVADDVAAAAVIEVAAAAGGSTLRRIEVFDLYRGPQIGENRTSLGLHLEFRADDRTLTTDDVARSREAITAALREKLGGELRG
jgi:phenylalanyl-tRNA synthetase beta chain